MSFIFFHSFVVLVVVFLFYLVVFWGGGGWGVGVGGSIIGQMPTAQFHHNVIVL